MTETVVGVDELQEAAPRPLQPPAACGQEMEHIDWAGASVFRVADVLIGVRFDSADVKEAVDDLLREHVVTDAEAPPFYSIRTGARSRRRDTAPMHYLYVGGQALMGSRDIRRVVGTLASLLGELVPVTDEGLLYVIAALVQSQRGTFLAPHDLLSMSQQVDKALTSEGVAIADARRLGIDVRTGEVVVPTSTLDLAWSAEVDSRLSAAAPSADGPSVVPGRYPLAQWLVSVGPNEVGPLRGAASVQRIAQLLAWPLAAPAQQTLDLATDVAARVTVTGVAWATADELVSEIARFVRPTA